MRQFLLQFSFLIFGLALSDGLLAQPAIEWDKLQTLSPGFGPNMRTACPTADGGLIVGMYPSSTRGSKIFVIKLDRDGNKDWERVYGGDDEDEVSSIIQTSDGGYLIGGTSSSGAAGDKTDPNISQQDYWIIKINADGTRQWDKTYGGAYEDYLQSLVQTADGGYLICGMSNSPANGIKTEGSFGSLDYWVIKVNAKGTKEWDKTIGGTEVEFLYGAVQAADGSYVLSGESFSQASGNKTAINKEGFDYWVVKLASDGTKLWDKSYGGGSDDRNPLIHRTADNGFLIVGQSATGVDGDKTSPCFGYDDIWIVKVNSGGEKQWDKSFGGSQTESIKSIWPTSDGGYIFGVSSSSDKSGNKTDPVKGNSDYWILKIDANGSKIFDKSIGGDMMSTSVIVGAFPTAEGGYIITGKKLTDHVGGDITEFGQGIWTVKLLSETNSKKLTFSPAKVDFSGFTTSTIPAQNVTLSANVGAPAVTLRKSPADWLTLPKPAMGPLSFSVNQSSTAPGNYTSVVAATSPGYARALLNAGLIVSNVTTAPILSYVGDRKIQPGSTLVFNAFASAGSGQTKVFSLIDAPAGATIDPASGAFGWVVPKKLGTYPLTVKVAIVGFPELSDQETIQIRVVDAALIQAVRINAGGQAFTTADGRTFEADRYFHGRNRTSSVDASVDIANTTDDALYQSGRCSSEFNYRIPVQKGKYIVTLYFAETYWGVYPGVPGTPESRKFNVYAEGVAQLSEYKIIERAGGPLKAVQESFEVQVYDGFLSLDFQSVGADMPRVSAIEAQLVQPVEILSLSPVADAYVRQGSSSGNNYGLEPTIDVKSTTTAELHRTAYIKFSLAGLSNINSAKLRIYGRNHEDSKRISIHAYGVNNDSWSETGITSSNAPTESTASLGSAAVNNVDQYYEIDVTSFVVAQQQAGGSSVSLLLNDPNNRNTRITFNSKEAGSYPPQLVIQTVNRGARLGQEVVMSKVQEKRSSIVFPNPVKDHFTVSLSPEHAGPILFEMINTSGNSRTVSAIQNARPGENVAVNIDGYSFNPGIYLLKIKSDTFTEVVKTLVTE